MLCKDNSREAVTKCLALTLFLFFFFLFFPSLSPPRYKMLAKMETLFKKISSGRIVHLKKFRAACQLK